MLKLLKPLILYACCSISIHGMGQKQEFIPFRNYSQGTGLTSYNITKILQDQFGFLWVGTQDGLNCFDGKDFLVFNREAAPQRALSGNNVTDMVEDTARNVIWLATSYGGIKGISTITHNVSYAITGYTGISLTDKWVRSLAIAGNMLWIGSYNGLYVYDLQSGRLLAPDVKKLPALNVSKLLRDPYNRVWAFCDDQGILVLDGSTGRLLDSIPAQALNTGSMAGRIIFWDVTFAGKQDIYAATSRGLKRLHCSADNVGNAAQQNDHFFSREEIFSCATDKSGNIWLANANGLYKYQPVGNWWSRMTDANFEMDSWQSAIYEIFIDRDGNTWIGSQEGLAYISNRKAPFEKFYRSVSTGVKIQHAFALLPVSEERIYCGAANGLYEVNAGSRTIERLDSSSSCYLVARLPGNDIIVSNSKGTFIIRNNRLIPAGEIHSPLKSIQHDLLSSAVRYNDSIMLFGSQLHNGLHIWNTRSGNIRSLNGNNSQLKLDNDIVNALYKDRKGQLWVLSEEQLFLFNPLTGSCRSFRFPKITGGYYSILFDICETRDSYWIAAYGTGLIETDKQMRLRRIISTKEGLCNNGVYKAFAYRDSLVMVTSNNGMSVLNLPANKIRNYYQQDGMQSSGFEQFCGAWQDDRFYAGGVNGFTLIRPRYFTANTIPPALYITRVKSDTKSGIADTTNLSLSTLAIPSNVLQTTVSFAALNYVNPGSTVFAYRIEEQEGDWISLGAQSFVSFTGMKPGRYTLLVRAANEDGYWSRRPVSITLIFLPKWYQTIWFRLLIIAAIAGLLYALYRFRIQQLKKQEEIRRNIASDLHDDLGSTLNSVKVLTHLAKREPGKEEHLNQIEIAITHAAAGLRDLIWVLDDSQDTVHELAERIKKFAMPVSNAHNIRLECITEADASDQSISKTAKRNLLLISKEAVNNSIKYADCSHIRIVISQVSRKISLQIRDNGKGFDMQNAASGNGLRNIDQRARQMHCRADITSSPGNGTVVSILPLNL